jgi:hypothetical protein
MIRHATVLVVIALIAVLCGCSKESPPASSKTAEAPPASSAPAPPPTATAAPAPTPPPAAAPASTAAKTQDTNITGVVAEVTECTRKDGVLSLKVRFRNTGSDKKELPLIQNRDYEKYYVSASSKKYFILKDSEGTYLTPQASSFGGLDVKLDPSGQYTWWAKFPAPPADVKTVTLYMKVAAPFEDIPVVDQ